MFLKANFTFMTFMFYKICERHNALTNYAANFKLIVTTKHYTWIVTKKLTVILCISDIYTTEEIPYVQENLKNCKHIEP